MKRSRPLGSRPTPPPSLPPSRGPRACPPIYDSIASPLRHRPERGAHPDADHPHPHGGPGGGHGHGLHRRGRGLLLPGA
ncbi:MAG: hypothetical protein MZV70_22380 [Desulfobacterales bacterium]|nr:hypothetical protein [Desulfobacterales bacterium]